MSYAPRLKKKYKEEIVSSLKEKFTLYFFDALRRYSLGAISWAQEPKL